MRMEQEKTNTQKIADFADKSLLIVDDDTPLRDRLSRAMEKKGVSGNSSRKRETGDNYGEKLPPSICGRGS